MTSHLHAHVASSSADCDGEHGHDYIVALSKKERKEHKKANGINDFHDLHFKSRVLSNAVSFSPLSGAKVLIDDSGFTCTEATEEGYRFVEVLWCEDESCDPNAASQYDQFAEMMGY